MNSIFFLIVTIWIKGIEPKVSFQVIGYLSEGSSEFGVSIDGVVTSLSTTDATSPLWSGELELPAHDQGVVQYKYVQLNTDKTVTDSEEFTRLLQQGTTRTPNEFYSREYTIFNHPRIPQVYDSLVYPKSDLFRDTEIPTFHLTSNEAEFTALTSEPQKPQASPVKVNLHFVNSDTFLVKEDVDLTILQDATLEFTKLSFKLNFAKSDFFGRSAVLFKSQPTDPTMIREKLYVDILHSLGLLAPETAWVRIYVNNKPLGLYLMTDEVGPTLLKRVTQAAPFGSLYRISGPLDQCVLQHKGERAADYEAGCYTQVIGGENAKGELMADLIQFMADLRDFDSQATPDPVNYWDASRLDLNCFIRHMAMEYLAEKSDGYWASANNYYLYYNPEKKAQGRWEFISGNSDESFGNGLPGEQPGKSYKEYAAVNQQDKIPLESKLILNSDAIKDLFEITLKEIVGWAFKPAGLFPRIESFEKMLGKEVAWDLQVGRSGSGKNFGWTIEDFHNSIAGPVKDIQGGIKPQVEARVKTVETQLGFTVESGIMDRVKP